MAFASDVFAGTAGNTIIGQSLAVGGGTWQSGANSGADVQYVSGGGAKSSSTSSAYYLVKASNTPAGADYVVTGDFVQTGTVSTNDAFGVIARSADFSSVSAGYFGQWRNTGNVGFQISKGYDTLLGTAVNVTPTASVTYRLKLDCRNNGSSVDLKLSVQRDSDSNFLTSAGTWQADPTYCCTATDSSSPFTSAGNVGFWLADQGGISTITSWSAALLTGPTDTYPLLWFKADAITGLSDGNTVTATDWLDSSGNGFNPTAAVGGTYKTGIVNGLPVVRFDGTSQYYTLPSVQPVNGRSFTKVVVFNCSDLTKSNNLLSGSGQAIWLNGTAYPRVWATGDTLQSSEAVTQGAWSVVQGYVATDAASFERFNSHILVNGVLGGLNGYLTGYVTVTDGTLLIGGYPGGLALFAGDIAEALLYDRLLGASEVNKLNTSYLNAKYGFSLPTFTVNLAFDGDSITCGAKGTPSWAQIVASNTTGAYPINEGVGAQTLADMSANVATTIDPAYGTTFGVTHNILVVFGGTNDICIEGTTGATAYSRLVSYCQDRQAVGWKVVVVTMLPRGDAGNETDRQTLNDSIRGNWATFADALADVETLAMGAANEHLSTTYYDGDQIHPNGTGHAALAGLIQTQVDSLLAPPTLATGLVSDWSFDSTPNDGVSSNDLTLINSPTYATGKLGNALQLAAGSSQYATAPTGFVSTLTTGWTVSCWIKPTSTTLSSSYTRVWDFGTGTSNYAFLTPRTANFGTKHNTPSFGVLVGGGTEYQATSPRPLVADTWYHLVVTGDGDRVTFYIDGTPVAGISRLASGDGQGPFMLADLGSTNQNYWGKSQFADPYLDSLVDQGNLWNRALTPWDVEALYNSGSGYALASLSGVTPASEPASSTRMAYTFVTFNVSEELIIYESEEGVWFRSVTTSYTPPLGETVRDPSSGLFNGKWWILYTSRSFNDGTDFGIAYADSSDLSSWTHAGTADCSSVLSGGSAPRCWAPEFAREQDGSLYLDSGDGLPRAIVSGCQTYTSGTADGFKMYLVKPTDSTLSSWTVVGEVTGTEIPTSGNGCIDGCPVLISGTWHLFFRDVDGHVIKCATSSSLGSGYDTLAISDLCGANTEGPCYLFIDGEHRVYVDRFAETTGMAYVQASTIAGLASSSLAGISTPAANRHGTVFTYIVPTVTGTGAITLGETTASGSGTAVGLIGSGTPSTDTATTAGSGWITVTGTGSLATDAATTSGTGSVVSFVGTGSPSTDTATTSGAGWITVTGTGTLTTEVATASGAGTVTASGIVGTGAIALDAATVSGAGWVTITGTGALSTQVVTVAGTGTVSTVFTGSTRPALTGSVTSRTVLTGSVATRAALTGSY